MQQAIGNRRRPTRNAGRRCAGERNTKPHGVNRGEISRLTVVASDKIGSILGWTQERLQFLRSVIVETQIGGRKFLLQHSGINEKTKRSAFHAVGRTHQHLALAFEVGARHSSIDGLRKCNETVVEPDVHVFAFDDSVTDFEYLLRVESHTAQSVIERQHRSRGQGNGLLLRSRTNETHGKQCA